MSLGFAWDFSRTGPHRFWDEFHVKTCLWFLEVTGKENCQAKCSRWNGSNLLCTAGRATAIQDTKHHQKWPACIGTEEQAKSKEDNRKVLPIKNKRSMFINDNNRFWFFGEWTDDPNWLFQLATAVWDDIKALNVRVQTASVLIRFSLLCCWLKRAGHEPKSRSRGFTVVS